MTDLSTQPPRLLSDDQVLRFITHGYHVLHPEYPAGLNEAISEQCGQVNGVGNEILASVPLLHQVYAHPEVRGALISLLGSDYVMNGHRHLHVNAPESRSQSWHQDGTNVRHHQVWCVLAMYYPHQVPLEQGPTMIMPGTHFRNAPTERLATYANIRGQLPLAVPAGTVAITHYDLWHAGSRNLTGRARYMLKFLFDRQAVPTQPSWEHDPHTVAEVAQRRVREHVGPVTTPPTTTRSGSCAPRCGSGCSASRCRCRRGPSRTCSRRSPRVGVAAAHPTGTSTGCRQGQERDRRVRCLRCWPPGQLAAPQVAHGASLENAWSCPQRVARDDHRRRTSVGCRRTSRRAQVRGRQCCSGADRGSR